MTSSSFCETAVGLESCAIMPSSEQGGQARCGASIPLKQNRLERRTREVCKVLFPAKQAMLLIEVRSALHSRRRGCAEPVSAPERFFMSYRNGDRSREHRLRKARIARRLKINAVREAAAKPATEAKPAKSK